jgi:hypothetical protein
MITHSIHFVPEDGDIIFLWTLLPNFKSSWCVITKDHNLDNHHCENLSIIVHMCLTQQICGLSECLFNHARDGYELLKLICLWVSVQVLYIQPVWIWCRQYSAQADISVLIESSCLHYFIKDSFPYIKSHQSVKNIVFMNLMLCSLVEV